jgi:hypothetical protein
MDDDRKRAGPVEADAVLAFLTETLADLASRIAEVEAHAADLVGSAVPEARRMVALQDLDLIRQTIEDAGRVAKAALMPASPGLDGLAATIRLETMRRRLLHGSAEGGQAVDVRGTASAGRVDLFVQEE